MVVQTVTQQRCARPRLASTILLAIPVVLGLILLQSSVCWFMAVGQASRTGSRPGCDNKCLCARLAGNNAAEVNLDLSASRFKRGSDPTKLATLRVGDEVHGTVTKVLGRGGIFVDVGFGKDGFIEAGELRDGFPIDGLKFRKGTKITGLRVLRVSKGKLWLTLRIGSLERGPRIKLPKLCREHVQAFEGVPQDQWLTGIVNDISTLGVFVVVKPQRIGQQVSAFLHPSEFTNGYEDEAILGGTVGVRILSIDVAAGSIRLTMKGVGDSTTTRQQADADEHEEDNLSWQQAETVGGEEDRQRMDTVGNGMRRAEGSKEDKHAQRQRSNHGKKPKPRPSVKAAATRPRVSPSRLLGALLNS